MTLIGELTGFQRHIVMGAGGGDGVSTQDLEEEGLSSSGLVSSSPLCSDPQGW